jgi:hypothetical protein
MSAGGMPGLHRQGSDYAYMGGMNVPPHMRHEMPQPSPRASPALTAQSYASNSSRPAITSHPNAYGPPPILEPPTTANHNQSGGTTSANGSPHMSAMGWQSPGQQALPSPGAQDNGYVYPEPQYQAQNGMYYQHNNIRRPNSTEPDHYNPNQREMGNGMWAPAVQ